MAVDLLAMEENLRWEGALPALRMLLLLGVKLRKGKDDQWD